ncbi:hypothetical protein Tco_0109432 [Tanacetum coccineum]
MVADFLAGPSNNILKPLDDKESSGSLGVVWTSFKIRLCKSMTYRRWLKLHQSFRICLKIGMLVWGEADSELRKEESMKKSFSRTCWHGLGGRLIQFMHTTMVPVQVKEMKNPSGYKCQDKKNSHTTSALEVL